MALSALAAAEARARGQIGHVIEWTVPKVRREDLGTWGSVTRDSALINELADFERDTVSAMYLVGQLQPHPWPTLDGLRTDGLALRDSPGADADDPVAVLHGGGRVELYGKVRTGMSYHARREVVAVETKGRADSPFLRVTVVTQFTDDDEELIAAYEEYILLRGVEA